MLRAGTLKFRAHHSCSLSWVWAAASPLPSPTGCAWSTPPTVATTGLSSPQSVCPRPLAVRDTLRAPSTPPRSTNTGGGSLCTCPVLLSMYRDSISVCFPQSCICSCSCSYLVIPVDSLSSPRTRFRWIQTHFTPGAEGWALDNVLLAPGCPWMCSGHGLCDNGRCM